MLYEIQLDSPFRTFDNDDAPSDYNYNYSTNVFDFVEEPETAPEGRTYGVEIELNPVRNNRQNFVNGIHQVFDLSPTFIVKSDSTISEYGGEIVTVPLGLDAMPALFEAIEASAPGQYTVSNACGVHIHAAVPNNIWTLARMYMIVMSRTSLAFGSHVFGRQPGDFHMRGEFTIRPSDAVDWARGRQRGNHRTALEFSNKGTLELRSFAGTTKATDLMCYAEYYDALIEFCSKRVQGVSIDDLNILAQFSAFVLASESRWPALATRLRCGSVEIIAGSTPYNHAVRGLFLPRAARTPEPRQPRLPAAVLDELTDLTTPAITVPGAQPYTPGWSWTVIRNAQTGETTRHRTFNGVPMSEPATPRVPAHRRAQILESTPAQRIIDEGPWASMPATSRSNAISGTVAQTLATRRAHFREMVEDRIEQSDEHAPFNRSIGTAGFSNARTATYGWLLRAIVGRETLRATSRSIDDYHIEISRTEMYAAINNLFSGRFTSSRGTVYAGRRLYTLILNYHLPRAFALINGTANGRPYGHNYCMELTAPNPTPPDRLDVPAEEAAAYDRAYDRVYGPAEAEVARRAQIQTEHDHHRRDVATQDEINRGYSLTEVEFERELAARVRDVEDERARSAYIVANESARAITAARAQSIEAAAEARVQNEIDRQVAAAVADASAPLTNFPTPLQAALFPTREQVAAHDRQVASRAAGDAGDAGDAAAHDRQLAALRERGIDDAALAAFVSNDIDISDAYAIARARATSNEHNERARRNYERTRRVSAAAREIANANANAAAENLRNEENARAESIEAAAAAQRIFRDYTQADTQAERERAIDAIFGLPTPPRAYPFESFTVNLPTPPLTFNVGQTHIFNDLTYTHDEERVSIGHAESDTPPIVDEMPF